MQLLPRDVDALLNLGLAFYKTGEFAYAVNAYRTALEIQPHHVDILNNLGIAYQALGKFSEAISAYQKALRLMPDLPELHANFKNARELQAGIYSFSAYQHYKLGLHAKASSKFDEAIAAWKQAIAESPNYLEAHLQLGQCYFESGAYELAIRSYLSATGLWPDNTELLYNLGNSYLYAGRLEAAVSAYQRAVELNPSFSAAWANMANVLLEMERFDSAISACESALKANTGYRAELEAIQFTLKTAQDIKAGKYSLQAYRLWNRGLAAANSGETSTALTLWERAAALSPHYAQVHENLGWLYFNLERFDNAFHACQTAQTLRPTPQVAQLLIFLGELRAGIYPFKAYRLWERGRRAISAGELESAVRFLSQAITAGAEFIEAYNTLAWLYVDKLETNLSTAERLARRAIFLAGEKPRAHLFHTLGWIFYKQGRYAEALTAFKEAILHAPDVAEYVYHASLASLRNGETSEALEYLSQAIARDEQFREAAQTESEFDTIRFTDAFSAAVQ